MIKGDSGVTEMTAKSEKVYGRILSLGGKRELIPYLSNLKYCNGVNKILLHKNILMKEKRKGAL